MAVPTLGGDRQVVQGGKEEAYVEIYCQIEEKCICDAGVAGMDIEIVAATDTYARESEFRRRHGLHYVDPFH